MADRNRRMCSIGSASSGAQSGGLRCPRRRWAELGSGNPYRLDFFPLFVGLIEDWEFPWVRPVLRTEPMSESELVRQQGGWVFAGSITNSILGFAFWALAAHLFTSTAVGT